MSDRFAVGHVESGETMSLMSMLALLVYFAAASLCLLAVPVAARQVGRPGDKFHWLACAVFFIGLAAARLAKLEDGLREAGRIWLKSSEVYGERAMWQAPAALAVFVAGFFFIWLFVHLWRRSRRGSRTRLVLVSRFAALSFIPLFGLRLVSLHQIDQLLYSGPLRLNWLLEGALCVAIVACALLYVRRFGRPQSR